VADSAEHAVEWAENLRHNPRPNEVPGRQEASQRSASPVRAVAAPEIEPASTRRPRGTPHAAQPEPSYYDISMLRRPVWKWEIAGYFFLGGLSAGAYILSRLADRIAPRRYRHLTRMGTYLSLLTFLPCPALLIHDLGDRKRFHHMLRVWKPGTPMNLGTWSIVAYSGMVTASAIGEYLRDRATQPILMRKKPGVIALTVHDSAGVPFALMMAGYTGVLLSCTSNPLWCKNVWLGPLFSASSIATGAEALSLALDVTRPRPDSTASRALTTIDTLAHAAEAGSSVAFTISAGAKARPLRTGSMRHYHRLGAGAMVLAEVLKRLPAEGKARIALRIASAMLGLFSGFALRWAIVHGGHEAASDPHLARVNSRARRARRSGSPVRALPAGTGAQRRAA
jgi:formate-dependent nitrite reductase membrane component NrfD